MYSMGMVVVALTLLGLCFGSFVEATSWRLHEQSRKQKRSKKQQRDLSITQGRSMCAHCKHQLAWYDLIPLVSWLSLGGKCRYCRRPIGWHAPLLELVTAGLFVLSYVSWPFVFGGLLEWVAFGLWLVIVTLFVLLTVYDLRWMLLPDRAVFPLQAVAGLYACVRLIDNGINLGGVALLAGAVGIGAGLFWVLYQVSRGAWIGGGDVKLGVALGLLAGDPLYAALILFVASLLGTFVGVPAMIASRSRKQLKIPFGPFLIAGTIIVVLFGNSLVNWYTHTVLGL